MSRFDQNRAPYRYRINRSSSQSYSGRPFDTKPVDYLIELEQCESRKILRLNAYWSLMVDDRRLPTRHDIDPGRIRDLLANVMIIELHEEPLRLRYRLVGTAISAAMGRDVTGKWLDEIVENPGKVADITSLFEQLRQKRAPIFGQSLNNRERRGCHDFHWAIFPLRDDADRISHALMIEDYGNLAATYGSAMTPSQSARA